MSQMVFINLPVDDLSAATAFYEGVGFTKNPDFSDHTASCMVLSDTIFVMLLTHEKFRQFTHREVADGHAATSALYAISRDSREAVDAIMDAAAAHGGKEHRDTQDLGFMYGRAFEDPDGHVWEPFYMDMAAAEAAFEGQQAA